MNTILGSVVVIAAVIVGYVLEKGNLHVLLQPVEFLIIFGAALGGFITGSPGKVMSLTLKDIKKLFIHRSKTKEDYVDLLALLYELFSKVRREGIISLENDIETPQKSEIFNRHERVIADKEVLDFLRDNFRVIVMGVEPSEVVEILEIDLETSRKESMIPYQAMSKIADALPGLGIVAAVLGVIITMGKISEPPEVLGHSIGAALVGTFLGVLACYGFAGPMASNLEHKVKEKESYFNVIKTALQRFDSSPTIGIEVARREVPISFRPTFDEFEGVKKKWKSK
jgi:chemotaxis protein MotA